jgi:hypothetical protein
VVVECKEYVYYLNYTVSGRHNSPVVALVFMYEEFLDYLYSCLHTDSTLF